ncbi:oxygen-regulated protein 1 [Echeneis naucrates]|uniref:oxygen-regulated protein 1 n=1 Tax=Echeneis naucrates TaxID=173247 RepID=UPI0011146751|nr:oxygen-regulated protein 1 [Echeneis naucrates]
MSSTPVQDPAAQRLSSGSGQTLPFRPLQPTSDPSASKRVCFYKSGDYKFSGHRMVINTRTFKTFDALLDALSKKVPLPFGVRTITTPRGTHLVRGLDDLQDGGSYVCSDQRRVKPLNVDEVNRRQVPWNTTRPPSASRRKRQGSQFGQFGRRNEIRAAKITERVAVRTPKKLVVIKNRDPTVKRTIVLQRRTAPTFDSLLDYLSQILQFPVLKLYSTDGRRVDGLAALILCSGFVVAAGNEPFRLGNNSFHGTGQIAQAIYTETTEPSMLLPRAQNNKSFSSGRGSRNFSSSSERYIVNQINKSRNGSRNSHLQHHHGSEVNQHYTSMDTCASGRGDHEYTCIVPQDDDIEKSFRVNQDGSMTVEMKVHLTIKEEEMLHWTTTLSRSSLSKRTACASISESGNSSPDSNNAVAKDSSSIADETKEENHPTRVGTGVGFNNEQVYEGYTSTALGKAKSHFKRAPTPGPRRVKKKTSVESVKMVTESGIQESTLGHYSYMERTADGETTTEGYCIVRHSNSSSSNRPIPKPRKTASADANKKGSTTSILSSGVAEVLQIQNHGMEVTETVMHIYEGQGCYDNYFANEDYNTDGGPVAAPDSKPSTESGPRSSSNDCDIDFSCQPSTADSLQRQREEILSLSSEPISPTRETVMEDKVPTTEKRNEIFKPDGNAKGSPSTCSLDKKIASPKKPLELSESVSMPSLNLTPSQIHQYVENWLENVSPDQASYTESIPDELEPRPKGNALRPHKSAEAIGPEESESTPSISNILSPKAKIKPVLRQLCSSIQCIRSVSDANTTSNLEKSNSLPDFSTQVASVFGSSCKAFLSFLSVMTLRDSITGSAVGDGNQSQSTSEAMLMMESLQKISVIEDEEEQRSSLTDLQSRASSEFRERWKDFQIMRERFESEPLSPKVSETEFALDVVSEGGDVFEGQIDELLEELHMPQDLKAEISSTIHQARNFYPVDESTFIETDRNQSDSEEDVEKFVDEHNDDTKQSQGPVSSNIVQDVKEKKQDDDSGDDLNKMQSMYSEQEKIRELAQEADEVQETGIDVQSSDAQTEREEALEIKDESEGKDDQLEEVEQNREEERDEERNLINYYGEENIGNEMEEENEDMAEKEDDEGQEKWEAGKESGCESVVKVEEGTEGEMTTDEEKLEREKEGVEETEEGTMETQDAEKGGETDEREMAEEEEEVNEDAAGEEENGEEGSKKRKKDETQEEADENIEEQVEEEKEEIVPENSSEEKIEEGIEEEEKVDKTAGEDEKEKEVKSSVEDEGNGDSEESDDFNGEVVEKEEEVNVLIENDVEEEEEIIGDADDENEEENNCDELEEKQEEEKEVDTEKDIEGEVEEVIGDTDEEEGVENMIDEVEESEGEVDVATKKDEEEEVEEVTDEIQGEEKVGGEINGEMEEKEEQEVDLAFENDAEEDIEGEEEETINHKGEDTDDNIDVVSGEDEEAEEIINETDEEEENINEDGEEEIIGEDCNEEESEDSDAEHCSSHEETNTGHITDSPTKYSSEGQCEYEKDNETDTVDELEIDGGGQTHEDRSNSLPHPVEISQELLDFVNSALQSSSLTFTYDARGNIRIEPDNAQVVQTKLTVIPNHRKDSSYGLKRLPSPSTSDLTDYRPETSESGGYKSQDSLDIVTESGEEASAKPFPVCRRKVDIPDGKMDVERAVSKVSVASNSEILQNSGLKSGESFSSYDSGSKVSREDLSYFSATSSSKADGEAAQCMSLTPGKEEIDGVLIDQGRWLLKENHLIRKSPPVSLGMYGNLDSTSIDTGQEESPPHYKTKKNPLVAISSSELEEMVKPQTPKCTYYNMPHGSDSDPFLDESSIQNGKKETSFVKGRGFRVSPTIDTSKTWSNKNGSLSSFASVELKMPDSRVHPVGESSAVTQARRTPSGGQRALQAQDSLDTLRARCGQYCPIL